MKEFEGNKKQLLVCFGRGSLMRRKPRSIGGSTYGLGADDFCFDGWIREEARRTGSRTSPTRGMGPWFPSAVAHSGGTSFFLSAPLRSRHSSMRLLP